MTEPRLFNRCHICDSNDEADYAFIKRPHRAPKGTVVILHQPTCLACLVRVNAANWEAVPLDRV